MSVLSTTILGHLIEQRTLGFNRASSTSPEVAETNSPTSPDSPNNTDAPEIRRSVSAESIFSSAGSGVGAAPQSADPYETGAYFNPDEEFLLQPDDRLSFSIRYPNIYRHCVKQRAQHWFEHEVKFLPTDRYDWDNKLNNDQRYFLKHVLAFFAASDMIVNDNLAQRFAQEVQLVEAQHTYRQQMAIEDIHSIVYANLIEGYIKDKAEKEKLFNAVKTFPVIAAKAAWCRIWMNSDRLFCERLAAFAIVEGVFFAGSFAAIFWMAEKGLLPAMRKANEFIARDESMHVLFAIELYSNLKTKTPLTILSRIFKEAVELETDFIVNAIPCKMVGMSAQDMTIYIRYTANRLFKMMTGTELFEKVHNPFPFMDRIALENKSNFFEKDVTNYTKMQNEEDPTEDAFSDL